MSLKEFSLVNGGEEYLYICAINYFNKERVMCVAPFPIAIPPKSTTILNLPIYDGEFMGFYFVSLIEYQKFMEVK